MLRSMLGRLCKKRKGSPRRQLILETDEESVGRLNLLLPVSNQKKWTHDKKKIFGLSLINNNHHTVDQTKKLENINLMVRVYCK